MWLSCILWVYPPRRCGAPPRCTPCNRPVGSVPWQPPPLHLHTLPGCSPEWEKEPVQSQELGPPPTMPWLPFPSQGLTAERTHIGKTGVKWEFKRVFVRRKAIIKRLLAASCRLNRYYCSPLSNICPELGHRIKECSHSIKENTNTNTLGLKMSIFSI